MKSHVYFDTHFDGFIPVSPVQDDKKHTIEYVYLQIAEDCTKILSCVLVHGWGGSSFRSPTSPHAWPRDSLPRYFPQLCIWTYGYRSQLGDPNSTGDFYDDAETLRLRQRVLRQKTQGNKRPTPMIFMVHSLGAWIFKEVGVPVACAVKFAEYQAQGLGCHEQQ